MGCGGKCGKADMSCLIPFQSTYCGGHSCVDRVVAPPPWQHIPPGCATCFNICPGSIPTTRQNDCHPLLNLACQEECGCPGYSMIPFCFQQKTPRTPVYDGTDHPFLFGCYK